MAQTEHNPSTEFDPGEFAKDTVEDEAILILDEAPDVAEEMYLPALDMTVADCRSNREFPGDDAVIQAVYISSLNYHIGQWKPSQIVGKFNGSGLSKEGLTIYHFPVSRISEL